MPIVAYNPEQLLMLSTYARSEPARHSPLARLYLQIPPRITAASQRDALQELVGEKMLVANKHGKPRLAKALEPVLFVLHRPEQVISFARAGRRDIGQAFFCRSGRIWVQDAVTATEALEVLAWPLRRENLRQWFAEELMGDVSVRPGGTERGVVLDLGGFVVLVALQEVYRRRVHAARHAMKGKALWIPRMELIQPDLLDVVQTVSGPFASREQLESWMADPVRLDPVVDALVADHLLFSKHGDLAYTATSRDWFDPGRLQAAVAVSSYGEQMVSKLLYVMDDTWILVEPAEGGRLRLAEHPGATRKQGIFERLLEGLS